MSDDDLADLVERALDYRGFVTVRRRDGSELVGFVYDRGPDHVELFDQTASQRVRLPITEIDNVVLTGDDAAARAQAIWERRRGALEPRETSAWGDWEDRPTLLVVALPRELRGIGRVLGAKPRGMAVTGRLGDHRAVALAVGMGGGSAQAIAEHAPRLVISCGFSGALDPWLRPGDVVLASSVSDEHGESIAVAEPDLRIARQALDGWQRVVEGEIVCTTHVAATRDEKRVLARRGRLAVDLESWAAARAARDAKIPWLGLRVVLDPIEGDLPEFTRERHAGYVIPALRHALAGSRGALDLARLALRSRIALRSLERALSRLAPVIASLHPMERAS
ncbi:MAG TPA: hypothetical protein VMJ10_17170 [Kofleriaceae bacterium]|nr:hypothetical protein [Kofleriaceae bacterium]